MGPRMSRRDFLLRASGGSVLIALLAGGLGWLLAENKGAHGRGATARGAESHGSRTRHALGKPGSRRPAARRLRATTASHAGRPRRSRAWHST